MEVEKRDLIESTFLEAEPKHEFLDCTTSSHHPPVVNLEADSSNLAEMKDAVWKKLCAGTLHLAIASWDYDIVSDSFKRQCEKAGFKDIHFEDGFRATGPMAKHIKGKYWLLVPAKKIAFGDSDTSLLPMVEPLVPDREVAALIARGISITTLKRSSIEAQEPFDLVGARHAEKLESPGTGQLIASQKFARFCRAAGAEMNWLPTHIANE